MNDICLIFPDEQTAQQVLTAAGLLIDGEPAAGVRIDAIDATPPDWPAGHHVNVLAPERHAALEPYIVEPEKRLRIWG